MTIIPSVTAPSLERSETPSLPLTRRHVPLRYLPLLFFLARRPALLTDAHIIQNQSARKEILQDISNTSPPFALTSTTRSTQA